MKFAALAKHWIAESAITAAQHIDRDTAVAVGEQPFTNAQLRDFKAQVRKELQRMLDALEKDGVIIGGNVLPSNLN